MALAKLHPAKLLTRRCSASTPAHRQQIDEHVGPARLPNVGYNAGCGAQVSPLVGKVEHFNRAAASLRDWFIEGEAPSRKELRTISDVVAVTTMLPVASIYKLVDDMVGGRVFNR